MRPVHLRLFSRQRQAHGAHAISEVASRPRNESSRKGAGSDELHQRGGDVNSQSAIAAVSALFVFVLQTVTRLARGQDVPGPRRIVFEFAPELGDVRVDGACEDARRMPPHLFQQIEP